VIAGEPKVFISYRREETAGHAGRLYDVMSSRFGDGNVFMDVDIAPGVDFVSRITRAVGACHVLLVIIGPRWATISDGGTLGRIFEPGDFVRLEVEEGLRRSGVAVIPVLVGGAKMPEPGALPAPLRPLTRRNALELSDSRWRYDVQRLMGALDRLLAGTSAVQPRAQPPAPVVPQQPVVPSARPEPPSPGGPLLALTTTLVAGAAGVIGRSVGVLLRDEPGKYSERVNGHPDWPFVKTSERVNHIADPILRNGFTWAVIGAAVAVWLTLRLRNGSVVGRLLIGALIGGLAGMTGSALVAAPSNLVKVESLSESKHRLLLVIAVAVTGAIAGALVGWVWRRRGSAGFAAGLLAGALYELVVTTGSWSADRSVKAGVAAMVIVGFTTATQVLLDSWAERSPRALATSRGP
jgi:hypothetical protein